MEELVWNNTIVIALSETHCIAPTQMPQWELTQIFSAICQSTRTIYACTITLVNRRIHITPDTRKQLLKNPVLRPRPYDEGLCFVVDAIIDQANKFVNNYFVGVVLLQHATPPHLNCPFESQPNPMAILILSFVTALQRTVA